MHGLVYKCSRLTVKYIMALNIPPIDVAKVITLYNITGGFSRNTHKPYTAGKEYFKMKTRMKNVIF